MTSCSSDQKLKILLCITGLEVGGAEKLVCELADQYAQRGHKVMLICLMGPVRLRPKNPAIGIHNLELQRNPRGLLMAVLQLRSIVRSFNPDVVNSHLVHANILIRLLRLFVSMPRIVTSAHNTYEGGRARMWGYRLTDYLTDISTNVSKEAVEAFEKQGALKQGRMVPIHNGISTDEFRFDSKARAEIRSELGIQKDVTLILAMGRLREQKDYPSLLQALSLLDESVNWALAVAGEGPLLAKLQSDTRDLGLSERVFWLGVRDDAAAVMSASDLFVLSSAWEGFGLVVAEAMACERPVVATDCGGVREVVGECGRLVPPKQPALLADALSSMLAQPESCRQNLGHAARQRIRERYSISNTAEAYLRLFRGDC